MDVRKVVRFERDKTSRNEYSLMDISHKRYKGTNHFIDLPLELLCYLPKEDYWDITNHNDRVLKRKGHS